MWGDRADFFVKCVVTVVEDSSQVVTVNAADLMC